MGCPPPIPQEIEGCDPKYFGDFVLIPYAKALQLWVDGDINCAEFIARVESMEVMYEGACGSSGGAES